MMPLPMNYSPCSSGYISDLSSSAESSPSNHYPQQRTSPSAETTTTKGIATRSQKIALLRGCSEVPVFQFLLDCLADPDLDNFAKWNKKHPYAFTVSTKAFAEEWSRRNGKRESFGLISRMLQTVEGSRVANQRVLLREKTGYYKFFPDYNGNGLPHIPSHELKGGRGSMMKDASGRNLARQQLHPSMAARWNPYVPMSPALYSFPHPHQQRQFLPPNQPSMPFPGYALQPNYHSMGYPAQMPQMYAHRQQSHSLYHPTQMSQYPPMQQSPLSRHYQHEAGSSGSPVMSSPLNLATGQRAPQLNSPLSQQTSFPQNFGTGLQNKVFDLYAQAQVSDSQASKSASSESQKPTLFEQQLNENVAVQSPVVSSPVSSASSSPVSTTSPSRQLPSILAEFLTPLSDSFEAVNDNAAALPTNFLDNQKENCTWDLTSAPANVSKFGLDQLSKDEPLKELHLNDWDFPVFH